MKGMILGFLEPHMLALIAHVFGAILGGGGAYMSDLMFLMSVRDRKISETELKFLRLGSKLVWTGIIILAVSGLILFFGETERYLTSGKFLAKMSIVGIIIANGFMFHISHIPRLHRHLNAHLPSSDEFMRRAPLLLASGAVSTTSWTCVIILGMLRSVPYSYAFIMTVYALALAVAITGSLALKNRILLSRE